MNEIRDMIIGLRGGLPDKCDFCGKETEPDNLHPEEAQMWVCNICIAWWAFIGEPY